MLWFSNLFSTFTFSRSFIQSHLQMRTIEVIKTNKCCDKNSRPVLEAFVFFFRKQAVRKQIESASVSGLSQQIDEIELE